MGNALIVLDKSRGHMDNSYYKYTTQYTAYIKLCEAHNLTQLDGNGNIPSTPALQGELERVVNSLYNDGGGWYHAGDTSTTDGEHVITRKYIPSGVEDDFEYLYECEGPCKVMFRTPYEAFAEHRTKWGTGADIDKEVMDAFSGADALTILAMIGQRLKNRSVQAGCGRSYYTCDSRKKAKHKVRTCNKCGQEFRRCMEHTFDHNPRVPGTSLHSDAPTVPDPPASFNLTPGRISIQLRWTDSDSDGGSAISDYQYQYSLKLTATAWEPWPDEWKSGGTDNYALITGLTRNRRYKVRMRAVNRVGESRATGFKIEDTLR